MYSDISYCPPQCTACRHKYLSDAESLLQKETFVKGKLAGLTQQVKSIRYTNPYKRSQYRNKVCLACFFDGKDWQAGIHKRDEILSVPHCPLYTPLIKTAWQIIRDALPKTDKFPLHWYVQCGKQIVLVLKSKTEEGFLLSDEIKAKLSETGIEGVWVHGNPATGRNVFAKITWKLIWGKPRSLDETGLEYGPVSFQQVLFRLYEDALEEAFRFFEIKPNEQVVDLYSGIGTSIIKWKAAGADTLGIELCGEAVECAVKNTSGSYILRGKCSERIPQINQWLDDKQNFKLFANPPRTGLEPQITEWLLKDLSPNKIAYLSCSPGTLQRDLQILSAVYQISKVIPFDFFPNTHHVETLVLLIPKLCRRDTDSKQKL